MKHSPTRGFVMGDLELVGVTDIPEVRQGDSVADLVAEYAQLQTNDVVVISSNVIARAEGQIVRNDYNDAIARQELIESQAVRVLRRRGSLFITETAHGFVCENAGIHWSEVEHENAVLLPRDPDRSAFKVRERLQAVQHISIGVIISGTFGRAWRNGATDVALGSSGIIPVLDLHGDNLHGDHLSGDPGDELEATRICIVDEIAGAAALVMRNRQHISAVIARGLDPQWFDSGTSDISTDVVSKATDDMFR